MRSGEKTWELLSIKQAWMEDLRPLQNGREGYKGQIRLSLFGPQTEGA